MTQILLTVIFIMLWLVSCAICAVVGFLLCKRFFVKEKPPPKAMTEKDRRAVEKAQHEYNNFLNYAGDEMTAYEHQTR